MTDRIRLGNAALTRVSSCRSTSSPMRCFRRRPPRRGGSWLPSSPRRSGATPAGASPADLGGRGRRAHRAGGYRCGQRPRPAARCRRIDHLDTDFLDSLRAARRRAGRRRRRHQHPPPLRSRRLEHHASTATPGCRRFPTPATSCRRPDYRYFHPDGACRPSTPRTEEEESATAACANQCSRTASFRSRTRWSCGPTNINSASRCGCGRRRATPRGRRWCGWTRASPRCSSAT